MNNVTDAVTDAVGETVLDKNRNLMAKNIVNGESPMTIHLAHYKSL